MKPPALAIPLLPALLLACGAPATQSANDSAAVSAEPANAAAAPAANAAAPAAAGPLMAYVGHPSNQEVDGVLFTDHPLVRAAVEAAVPDAAVRRHVLSEGTSGEIALRDGRLVSNACEPHNCGPHNWTILIDPAGAGAEVCYHGESTGDRSNWYAAGRPVAAREGGCPTA